MSIVMPIMKPIPIDTRGLTKLQKVWTVLTAARRWQLVGDWMFVLPDGRIALIPAGFTMDGASTPKFMWGILDPVGILLLQGIIHDFGYRFDYILIYDPDSSSFSKQSIGAGQAFWDRLFYDVGISVTGLRLTSLLSYWMLRVFGRFAWRANRKLNEQEIVWR